METTVEKKEVLLNLIDQIPESYREETLKVLIDFAEFLKFKAEKKAFPFLLCRSAMEDWLSPEEDKAWKYLEEKNKK